MALQSLGGMGMKIGSIVAGTGMNTQANSTVDAAGESYTGIGRIHLEAGSGTKTISSSGGKIYVRFGNATFANAGTNLRIGIQDVAATGLEDGTFDVYADLVGGTDTITANTIRITAMETGSKNISHGDLIAISCELTTRGGADTLQINKYIGSFTDVNAVVFPYATADTGAGPTRSASISTGVPAFLVEFDDGSLGWFEFFYLGYNFGTAPLLMTYASDSATDEYSAVFKVPFPCSINGAGVWMTSVASTDDFELILYSDPLGTPVPERTVTVDADYTSAATAIIGTYHTGFSPFTLSANTYYAIAVRPTTTNQISLGYYDLGSGNEKMKTPTIFGTNIKLAGRADQTGAFTEVQNYYLPILWLSINKVDDGVQTGGSSTPSYANFIG